MLHTCTLCAVCLQIVNHFQTIKRNCVYQWFPAPGQIFRTIKQNYLLIEKTIRVHNYIFNASFESIVWAVILKVLNQRGVFKCKYYILDVVDWLTSKCRHT